MCFSPLATCVDEVNVEDSHWCVLTSELTGMTDEPDAEANSPMPELIDTETAQGEVGPIPVEKLTTGDPGMRCLPRNEEDDDAPRCNYEFDTCHPDGYLAREGEWCLMRAAGKVKPSHGQTVIFNTFVWMQVFNEFNARLLGNSFLPTKGLADNRLFWFVIVVISVVQLVMTLFGGAFTSTLQLNGREWAGCLLFAFLSIPFGALLRLVPVPEESQGSDDDAAAVDVELEEQSTSK